MQLRLVLLALAFGCAIASRGLFEHFKREYGITYASTAEEEHRFYCFEGNLETIQQFIAEGEKHGINEYTDLCPEEFKATHHNLDFSARKALNASQWTVTTAEAKAAASGSIDWRTKGAVTPIKNQAACGSCWTFSAVCALEGAHFMATGNLIGLSEEELCQCAKSAGQGCQGGWMDKAIEWVVQNGGIDSEADYPYTSGGGRTGTCDKAKEAKHVAKFSKMVEIAHDEDQMASYVQKNGPISIGVDASRGWQTYMGGIKKTCTGRQIDHGVAIVGYGEEAGTPYWIVKNSWGKTWGEHGYIRLERGTNQCNLKGSPSSAIGTK